MLVVCFLWAFLHLIITGLKLTKNVWREEVENSPARFGSRILPSHGMFYFLDLQRCCCMGTQFEQTVSRITSLCQYRQIKMQNYGLHPSV